MSKMTRRLGRGLDSLVSNIRDDPPAASATAVALSAEAPPRSSSDSPGDSPRSARNAPLAMMIATPELKPNPFQPRDLGADTVDHGLVDSIKLHGILQPITARRIPGGFQIIAGERRWRAAREAGLNEVPVIIRDADDEQMLELALIENIQREDLNAIERAKAYRLYCDRFGMRAEQVAERVGEDRTTVTNYLRLLDLPGEVQALVALGKLGIGHARAILSDDDAVRQRKLAKLAVERELSVRAVEETIREGKTLLARGEAVPRSGTAGRRMAHLADLQRRFEEAVKTRVTIKEGKKKGSGKIIIEYYTLDDFDRVAARLGVHVE